MSGAVPSADTLTVAIPELGDDCWVELRDPYPHAGEISSILTACAPLLAAGKSSEYIDEASAVLVLLVVAWSVQDPESDELLPIPSEDRHVMRRVPVVVHKRVQEAISARLEHGTLRATES